MQFGSNIHKTVTYAHRHTCNLGYHVLYIQRKYLYNSRQIKRDFKSTTPLQDNL